jgi:transposase-like protein
MVIWGLLDSETRFLLALQVSSKRGAEEAQRLIQKGLNAAENTPSELVSDGLDSYRVAIEKEFNPKIGKGDVIHIRGPLTVGFNNKMERFHGVLKNRVKTMCRLQSGETAKTFVKGFETYYNFIKGHKALNGKTPAQAAGITRHKEDWLDLILKAEKYNVQTRPNF